MKGKGYEGRGAAGQKPSSSKKVQSSNSGTLTGGNTGPKKNDEMRADVTAKPQHQNPYPSGMGGGHGPGRS